MDPRKKAGEQSDRKAKSKPKCFRILDIPDGWHTKDLQLALETLDRSLRRRTYSLSLYPACHGMGKVAILKLDEGTEYFDQISPGMVYYEDVKDEELAIDCDFEGLTPLNTPSGEIVAE
jgi:hypothetical protein